MLSATTQQPPQFADFTYIGEYQNHYIYYHNAGLNWLDARQKCLNNGGDLLVINNAQKQSHYASILNSNSWIGLYQDVNDPNYSEPSGGWKWVDGTPLTFENWNSGEPNNVGGEDYGHFTGGNHFWNDLPLSSNLPFTMQLDKSAANILSVTCNGGSNGQTYVTGAGGTLPYNYLWNDALSQTTDTAINLAPGNYSVTITDSNGCTASDVSTITEPNVIIGKDVQFACDSYTWIDGNIYTTSNNSATDTLIAANGCDSIVTLELTVNYNNAATDVQVACDTLTWIDGITYSASNNTATYMLPTKGGCDSLVTLNLTINNSPIVELGNDTTICANTTFTLDAGSGFNYSWSDKTTNQIFPVINTGDYDVTVTDGNGCKDSDTITVTISSPLILNFDSDSVSCNGGSNGTATVTVTGGTPNYTYLWNDILAQTTATATNLAAGTYSVTVTDDNNCTATGSITVEEPTLLTASVQEPDNIPDFTFAGEYNNQFIYYHSDPLSWTDARAKAQANNGDLVIIQNANDNAYFTSVTIAICWIGMYQDLNDPNYSEPAGAWKWIDGSPLSYSNWAANEPNNSGIQNYGCFNYGGIGFWDDVGANGLPFIMAIDLGSANSLSVSCNGGNDGQTYVTAAGGTVPYSYAWD